MSDPNVEVKRRQFLLVGGAIGGILILMVAGMFLFDSSPPSGGRQKGQTVNITAPGTLEDRDAWRGQQAAQEKTNESQIKEVRSKLTQAEELIKKHAKDIEELRKNKSSYGIDKTVKDDDVLQKPLPLPSQPTPMPTGTPITANTGPGQKVLAPPTVNGGGDKTGIPVSNLNTPIMAPVPKPKKQIEIISFGSIGGAAGGSKNGGEEEVLGFPVDESAKKFGTPKGGTEKNKQIEFIPAGSFVRVAMLNGIDAPTGGQAQGNPLPVAFHVLDPANLPSKYKLDIKDCRVIGAAWGDLSSERSMIRLETLSCVLGNGETVEMAIKGQAIGEDGKAGLRGRLVTKQGQLLANALFAGALSGIGRAFQQSATTSTSSGLGTTQTVDPNRVWDAAIGGGVGQAGQMLAQYYLKAADKLFPVIETDGGRTIELLVTKGAVYSGKSNIGDEYKGLLKRSNTRGYEDD